MKKKFIFNFQSLNENNKMDFTDPEASKELTRIILKNDFNLEWDMPLNHLIPPVMNRVNYIYWINDLIKIKCFNENIKGIDIGVGASCIYPLLGNSVYGWKFIGTEIDQESVKFSNENIKRNKLENEILIIHVDDDRLILNGVIPKDERFDFCMCNPPFFSNELESERNNPKTICTGNKNELMTEGGEFQFISQIITESLLLKNQICWFTSMIGKKETLKSLKLKLNDLNILYYITEFINGNITRWGIAWSFKETSTFTQQENLVLKKKENVTISNIKYSNLIQKIKKILNEGRFNYTFDDVRFLIQTRNDNQITVEIFQLSQNQFSLKLETKEISEEFQYLYQNLKK
jgi:23S rRNA A1618 N6-methylase RlmF